MKMETTIVYRVYMGIMEKKMETTIMGSMRFKTTSRWLHLNLVRTNFYLFPTKLQ